MTKEQEDQAGQAAAVANIWNTLPRDQENKLKGVLGVTFMSWEDELWKGGNNSTQEATGWSGSSSDNLGVALDAYGNEEYFGWVDENGKEKDVVAGMQKIWGSNSGSIAVDKQGLTQKQAIEEGIITKADITPKVTTVKDQVVFSYYKEPQTIPNYLPAPGVSTHMSGESSDFEKIKISENKGCYVDLPEEYKKTLELPAFKNLTKFAVYTEDNSFTGWLYREPVDVFGRTVVKASSDLSEVYIVLKFQDTNVYQPALALKLVQDPSDAGKYDATGKYIGRYIVVQIFRSNSDLVSVGSILNNFSGEVKGKIEEDLKNAIRQIKNMAPNEEVTEDDLWLVENKVNIEGEKAYTQYVVPGDIEGRALIINRGNTIFISKQFIGITTIPYDGYFVDKQTGSVVLIIKNTDDQDNGIYSDYSGAHDVGHQLGADLEKDYYRVGYYNPNTGELWYRWHYPYHIWNGWDYEERGYFTNQTSPKSYRWHRRDRPPESG
jgi:hypothetical protein